MEIRIRFYGYKWWIGEGYTPRKWWLCISRYPYAYQYGKKAFQITIFGIGIAYSKDLQLNEG